MRLRSLLVVITILAPRLSTAQTGLTDGVHSLIRGDYPTAQRILQPLAERWPEAGDPVAQFFVAMMYESGRGGLAADTIRACALYGLGAFGASPGPGAFNRAPFSTQSLILFQRVRQSLGTEQFDDCVFLQSIGFDHGFEPATFALESSDSIAIDLRSATITYRGKQRRIDRVVQTTPGVTFLPIEHTRLLAGPARSTPHHYIEVLSWFPSQRETWILRWSLSEIVRDNLVPVASGELTRVSAPRPPASSSFDLRELVRLGVNDAGIPEWTILTGPDARSQGIPSEAERDDIAALERARRVADARVDSTRGMDSSRNPSMNYSDANGCGNVRLYGWSLDRGEAISVTIDKDLVPITPGGFVTLTLPHPAVNIEVQVYDRPRRSLPFCTDVAVLDGAHLETWTAIAGTVTIELSPRGVRTLQPDLYRATIRIADAELRSATGTRLRQTPPVTLAAWWVSTEAHSRRRPSYWTNRPQGPG